jgi:hypothetical protein
MPILLQKHLPWPRHNVLNPGFSHTPPTKLRNHLCLLLRCQNVIFWFYLYFTQGLCVENLINLVLSNLLLTHHSLVFPRSPISLPSSLCTRFHILWPIGRLQPLAREFAGSRIIPSRRDLDRRRIALFSLPLLHLYHHPRNLHQTM